MAYKTTSLLSYIGRASRSRTQRLDRFRGRNSSVLFSWPCHTSSLLKTVLMHFYLDYMHDWNWRRWRNFTYRLSGISGLTAEGYCQIAPFLQSEAISISNPYIVTCLAREGAASKSLRLLWHTLHHSLMQFSLCSIEFWTIRHDEKYKTHKFVGIEPTRFRF